jgi:hypothetical protein
MSSSPNSARLTGNTSPHSSEPSPSSPSVSSTRRSARNWRTARFASPATYVGAGATWNDGVVHKDHYIIWVEDRGEQTYSIARKEWDKYGGFDTTVEILPEDALLGLTDEQAKSLGLVNTDITLAELLGIRYCDRFMNAEA